MAKSNQGRLYVHGGLGREKIQWLPSPASVNKTKWWLMIFSLRQKVIILHITYCSYSSNITEYNEVINKKQCFSATLPSAESLFSLCVIHLYSIHTGVVPLGFGGPALHSVCPSYAVSKVSLLHPLGTWFSITDTNILVLQSSSCASYAEHQVTCRVSKVKKQTRRAARFGPNIAPSSARTCWSPFSAHRHKQGLGCCVLHISL